MPENNPRGTVPSKQLALEVRRQLMRARADRRSSLGPEGHKESALDAAEKLADTIIEQAEGEDAMDLTAKSRAIKHLSQLIEAAAELADDLQLDATAGELRGFAIGLREAVEYA